MAGRSLPKSAAVGSGRHRILTGAITDWGGAPAGVVARILTGACARWSQCSLPAWRRLPTGVGRSGGGALTTWLTSDTTQRFFTSTSG